MASIKASNVPFMTSNAPSTRKIIERRGLRNELARLLLQNDCLCQLSLYREKIKAAI